MDIICESMEIYKSQFCNWRYYMILMRYHMKIQKRYHNYDTHGIRILDTMSLSCFATKEIGLLGCSSINTRP